MKAVLGINDSSFQLIGGKSLLAWNIENLRDNGVTTIFLVGAKEPGALPENVVFIKDPGLGDGGVLSLLSKKISSNFAYIPAPIFFNVDLKRALKHHCSSNNWITIFAGPRVPLKGQRILIEGENSLLRNAILEDEKRDFDVHNLVDLGIYIVSPEVFALTPANTACSFFKDIVMPARIDGLSGIYHTSEYARVLTDTKAIEDAIKRGIPEKRNLKNPQKAIFLDRDGTINRFGDFVVRPDMLILMKKSAEAIRLIDDSEYIPIVVTNQPIVARGEATLETLDIIHCRLETLLEQEGCYVNDIYFCPHDIDKTKEWNASCDCRKPKIGMLLKAKERYNIDFASSWMVGDTTQDVQTGLNAGTHAALLLCGDPRPRKRFPDAKADFEADDLLLAVEKILNK